MVRSSSSERKYYTSDASLIPEMQSSSSEGVDRLGSKDKKAGLSSPSTQKNRLPTRPPNGSDPPGTEHTMGIAPTQPESNTEMRSLPPNSHHGTVSPVPSLLETVQKSNSSHDGPSIVSANGSVATAVQSVASIRAQQQHERSAERFSTLSHTLTAQADQLATMERDYLNLITNLEGEKHRVSQMLERRTRERDEVKTEVEKLRQQLASSGSLSSQTKIENREHLGRIASIEYELERCKNALLERDRLIAIRNKELEGMKEDAGAAAEEKQRLEEMIKCESEKKGKSLSSQMNRIQAKVTEKDEIIKEKEEEIKELRESLAKRKKERESLKREVLDLREELEQEQEYIAEAKKSMAGYRREIRRLEAVAEDQEEANAFAAMRGKGDLSNRAADANEKVDALIATLDARSMDNDNLNRLVCDLQSQLKLESERVETLTAEIFDLKKNPIRSSKGSSSLLIQSEMKEQAAKISEMKAELNKKDQHIEELEKTKANLTKEMRLSSGLNGGTDRIGREINSQIQVNGTLDQPQVDADWQTHILDVEKKLEISNKDNESLRTSLREMEDLVTAKEDEVVGIKSIINIYEQEKDALSAQLSRTKMKLVEAKEGAGANGITSTHQSDGTRWYGWGSSSKSHGMAESPAGDRDKIIEEKTEELIKVMTDLRKCNEEREEMRSQLSQLKSDMNARLNDSIQEKQRVIKENSSIREDLDRTMADNDELKKQVCELKDQLLVDSKNSSVVPSNLDTYTKEEERKRERVSQLREESAFSPDIKRDRLKIKSLEASLNEKQIQLEDKSAEIKTLKGRIEQSAIAEMDSGPKGRKEVEDIILVYKETVNSLQKDLSERDSLIFSKNNQIGNLRSDLEARVAEEQTLRKEVSDLRSLLAGESETSISATDGRQNKDREVKELRNQLLSESRRSFELSQKESKLKEGNIEASEKNGYLIGELDSSTGSPSISSEEQNDNSSLKRELESTSHQLHEIRSENDKLRSQLAALRPKDMDVGRRSAILAVREKRQRSWSPRTRVSTRHHDTDILDDCDSRDQSRGDRNDMSEEIHTLRTELQETKQQKEMLNDDLIIKGRQVDELAQKCKEYRDKIYELERLVAGHDPVSNGDEALILKQKECERLRKDMVSLKMLASARFRELESRAARSIHYEEEAGALRVAIEDTMSKHRAEMDRLHSHYREKPQGAIENKNNHNGADEHGLHHKYEQAIRNLMVEKERMRREVLALTAERDSYFEQIQVIEQRESSSMDVSSKMIMNENHALKMAMRKLNLEKRRLRGRLEEVISRKGRCTQEELELDSH